MRACNVDLDALQKRAHQICRRGPGDPHHRRWRGRQAHDRIPARRSARRSARAEFRPRRGDRRQRAGRALLRARKPRRLLPAGTEHVAARCRELYEPRHRQAPGHEPVKAGARLRRGGREFREGRQAGHRRARSLLRQPERQGAQRPHRSLDRPRAGSRAHDPDPLPPPQEQPAVRGRSRRRQDRHRRRPRAQDRQGRSARSAQGLHDLFARHGLADRGHPLSRRFRGTREDRREGTGGARRAPSSSSTRSTP